MCVRMRTARPESSRYIADLLDQQRRDWYVQDPPRTPRTLGWTVQRLRQLQLTEQLAESAPPCRNGERRERRRRGLCPYHDRVQSQSQNRITGRRLERQRSLDKQRH